MLFPVHDARSARWSQWSPYHPTQRVTLTHVCSEEVMSRSSNVSQSWIRRSVERKPLPAFVVVRADDGARKKSTWISMKTHSAARAI